LLSRPANYDDQHSTNLAAYEIHHCHRADGVLFAVAEAVWSPKAVRDYDDFLRRLKTDEHRLDQLGVNYRNSALCDGTDSQNQTK
jgi:N-acetyl-beta-hexosaminidase